MVKLKITVAKPMSESHADYVPRQPRVARAGLYPAKNTQITNVHTCLKTKPL